MTITPKTAQDVAPELLPCPFCGDEPHFEGDAGDWQNDARYVELSLTCCSTMSEEIGWMQACDMTVEERTAKLQTKLAYCWNTRAAQAAQPTRKPLSDAVKLTDYDLQEIASIHRIHFYVGGPAYKFAREIEAAHGIGAQE